MKVELDRQPSAGQITSEPIPDSYRGEFVIVGRIEKRHGEIVFVLSNDYHLKIGDIGNGGAYGTMISRSVGDRSKNPNWPDADAGQVPGKP